VIASLTLTPFDATRWVARSPEGHHLLVGDVAKAILSCASSADSDEAAFEALRHTRPDITRQRFDATLAKFRELLAKPPIKPVTRSNLTVLTPDQVAVLARPFAGLFHPRIFLPLFLSTVALSAYLSGYQLDLKAAQCVLETPLDVAIVTATLLISVLVHELGHAAALLARGRRPGVIGAGMYAYILPVAYVELNEAWSLPMRDRLVVNLGGITTHLLFGLLVAGIAELTPSYQTLLHGASLTIFSIAAVQLLPFLRRDGYWVLTDLLRTPNLIGTPFKPTAHALLKARTWRDRATLGLTLAYLTANATFLAIAAYLLVAPVTGIVQNAASSIRYGAIVPSLLSLQTLMTLVAFALVASAITSRINQLRRRRAGEGN